jgi:hypothetical protein
MDAHDANLLGVPDAHLLDALVFSSPASPWRDVMVVGQWIMRVHHHAGAEKIATQFVEAMHSLWAHEMNVKI